MKKYTIDEIEEEFSKNGYHLLENQIYLDCKTKLKFRDDEGYLYSLSFDSFLSNIRIGSNSLYKYSTRNEFSFDNILHWIKINKKQYEIISGSFINASKRNLEMRCFRCDNQWITNWNGLQSGKGCCSCSAEMVGLKKRIGLDVVLNIFTKRNLKIIEKSSYSLTEKKVECECLKCGHIFMTDYNHVKRGRACPKCDLSHGERRIQLFLEENNIQYEPQKRFENCKFKKALPFDFYLPNYNLCIEYNGEQHYISVNYFGGDEALEKTKIKDNIKRNFCYDNNIGFIEINYLDFGNIETLLSKYIVD